MGWSALFFYETEINTIYGPVDLWDKKLLWLHMWLLAYVIFLWAVGTGCVFLMRLTIVYNNMPQNRAPQVAWWLRMQEAQETRIPSWGVRKIPWRRNGNPLEYSCLENCMDRRVWWATSARGRTESDTTEHTYISQNNFHVLYWIHFLRVFCHTCYFPEISVLHIDVNILIE